MEKLRGQIAKLFNIVDIIRNALYPRQQESLHEFKLKHTLMHISNKLNAPLCAMPSRRLLKFCRLAFLTGFLSSAFFRFSSSANSFPQGVHSNPPSGPVLLYGVTVNRFPQISQLAN